MAESNSSSPNIDINKLSYDLALVYAKAKFENDLINKSIPRDPSVPDFLSDTEYLMSLFSEAFNEYSNFDIEYFKENFPDCF